MSFSFGVVNLFEFICLVSLGGALSVCRAWQRFSEHDWWVRANSVFLVLRTFPSVCGIQVLPGGEGKIPFLPACVARLLHQYACLQLSHFLLPFLSTSVFILIKQMKTLIEAGDGGGLRWRGMLQEMYVTHWGCKSAWTAAQTVQQSALSLVAGQNQVVMGCYSSWKRSRAGGDRWKLFSVLFQESKNIQALCASCWTGATKKSP